MGAWWLSILYYISYAVTVVADIACLTVVWPAFKRTRHRAFLLLAAGSALGIFDTICDHTLGTIEMPRGQYVAFRTLRRFTYYADVILIVTGIILLTRAYLSVAKPQNNGHHDV
jgi:hypothetical protein